MKMTVQEVLEKLTKIDDAINIIDSHVTSYGRQFPGQEPLYQVIDRLNEYRKLLLDANVNIEKE